MITDTELLAELNYLCALRPMQHFTNLVLLLIQSYTNALRREEALREEVKQLRAALDGRDD